MVIPVSVIIPTCNRVKVLETALISIAKQDIQFEEIIIIDASSNELTKQLCERKDLGLLSNIRYYFTEVKGAAVQRIAGVELSKLEYVAFMDDDVILDPDCIGKLWECISSNKDIGGVNALVKNQQFHPIGKASRAVYRLFASNQILNDLEGRTIGPVVNFLCSENNKNEIIPVDWLNLGLTIYRSEALPQPVFYSQFKGYSYMEDVALSITVSRNWKIYTVRDARIFHDSQPADYKKNVEEMARMELENRYFIMTRILKKNKIKDKMQLAIFQLFHITASGNLLSIKTWKGKLKGLRKILADKKKN